MSCSGGFLVSGSEVIQKLCTLEASLYLVQWTGQLELPGRAESGVEWACSMPAMVGLQADRKFSDNLPELVGRFSDDWLKRQCYRVVLSTCQVSCVTCHLGKLVELCGRGSVVIGANPVK